MLKKILLLMVFAVCALIVRRGLCADIKLPELETKEAISLKEATVALNGRINPQGVPTSYYFEYGPSINYGSRTKEQDLPPQLGAYYYQGWNLYGKDSDFRTVDEVSFFEQGGYKGGFVRVSIPNDYEDENHVPNMGILNLVTWLITGEDEGTIRLAGGDPDLRNAKIFIALRGHDFKANGTEFLWWMQSRADLKRPDSDDGWVRTNWVYTGAPLTKYLQSEKWEYVSLTIDNNVAQWSYAGTNPSPNGGVAHMKYQYWPLDKTLSYKTSDFIFLLAHMDRKNPPKGNIDLDEFLLYYSNKSLVYPNNGGMLVEWPDGSSDPSKLTDGWRFGDGKVWQSASDPGGPQEFIYQFRNPVVVEKVQIHQNPDWPGKDVEVLVSEDGKQYRSIAEGEITHRKPRVRNYDYFFKDGLSEKARYLKVVLKSGYQNEYWGLGEIEIFGEGAQFKPDARDHFVNADIENIELNKNYHYRLVAHNGEEVFYGRDKTFKFTKWDYDKIGIRIPAKSQ